MRYNWGAGVGHAYSHSTRNLSTPGSPEERSLTAADPPRTSTLAASLDENSGGAVTSDSNTSQISSAGAIEEEEDAPLSDADPELLGEDDMVYRDVESGTESETSNNEEDEEDEDEEDDDEENDDDDIE
ncbi:hypothetical protein BKA70DRAFT_1422665 [Coprinopsis sp. MPI-PUGE-AT-0042]|nr:hypothetical protein BKA70DRAFT_1422665 [Coprinopsis sp. MPI-PUGE-AT-0042]